MSLFPDEHAEKMKKLDKAMDSLRGKYGEQAVMRASLLGERKNGLSSAKMKKKREEQKQSCRQGGYDAENHGV